MLLLLAHASLSGLAAWGDAATYDETAHLTAGAMHLRGDFRLNPEHPPLAKAIAALGLLPLAIPDLPADLPNWKRAHLYPDSGILVGYAYLYGRPQQVEAQRALFAGRLPMLVLSLLLGLLLWGVARRLGGPVAGLIVVALWAFEPTGLAHGHLVTNDVAMALIGLVLALAAGGLARRPSWRGFAGFGVLAGVALLTKFTAIPWLIVLVGGLLLHAALLQVGVVTAPPAPAFDALSETSREPRERRARPLLRTVGGVGLAMLIAWGLIWAGYGFRFAPTSDPTVRLPVAAIARHAVDPALLDGLQPKLVGHSVAFAHAHALLPEAFLFGLCYASNKSQQRRTYLLGEVRDRADWRFFPLSLLTKLPLALLLLTALGLVQLGVALRGRHRWVVATIGLSASALFVMATLGRLAIGIRHILPAVPALLLLAGAGWLFLQRRSRVFQALAAALLLWHAAAAVANHPHHLAYFNEAAGGPEQGSTWFVDSNLDWGQDLGRLGAWMRTHDVPWLNLAYFGTDEPRRHGVVGPRLDVGSPYPLRHDAVRRPGLLAISETARRGLELGPEGTARVRSWLLGAREIGHIGGSIRLYVLP